ncbi:MAG: hypothetical protein JWO31_888 [Phycisphaerales bacterium]|nr:hypothetical protein [Phycisphaerales bacterium]
MKTFKDNEKRTWNVAVNVGTIKRVRDVANVDLLKLGDGDTSLIARLSADPMQLVDVLYALCKPQAEADGVTPDQFAEAMAGDAVEAGLMALLGDLADFFPSGRREVMRKLVGKVQEIGTLLTDKAGAEVDSIDALAVLAKVTEELEASRPRPSISGGSPSSSPASSASTLTP